MTTPLSGKIFLSAGWDLLWKTYNKFAVPSYTSYEAMNDSAKCRKLGGLG